MVSQCMFIDYVHNMKYKTIKNINFIRNDFDIQRRAQKLYNFGKF